MVTENFHKRDASEFLSPMWQPESVKKDWSVGRRLQWYYMALDKVSETLDKSHDFLPKSSFITFRPV